MANSVSDIISTWLDDDIFTVHDLADASGRKTNTIYGYAGGKPVPSPVARDIGEYALKHRGITAIQRFMAGPKLRVSYTGETTTNGEVDDEVVDWNVLIGEIIQAHAEGDASRARELLSQIDRVTARMRGEVDRLP